MFDPVADTLSICSLITSISAVIAVFVTFGKSVAKAVRTPEKAINKRIDYLNKVSSKALLALLDHAINGNNEQGLKDAREELHNYLIDEGKENVK